MMFRYSKTLVDLLRRTSPTIVSSRGIKAEKKIFRTKLPRYKIDLGSLPPHSELLTQEEDPTVSDVHSHGQLMSEKLTVYKQFQPPGTKTILLEALFKPDNDVDQLLRIIDENLLTMSSYYIALSFEVLDDMMRFNPDTRSTIAVSPELKRLATRALYKLRYFEADELLRLIKCVSRLGMPEDTLLVQSALQMTRHLINDFEPDELKCLEKYLERFEVIDTSEKSLLAAIKRAVPKAMQMQTPLNQRLVESK